MIEHLYTMIIVITNNFISLKTSFLWRGGSRTAATSKMECFVIIVNGWKPLTIITKHSILDVAAVLDPSLLCYCKLDLLKIYFTYSDGHLSGTHLLIVNFKALRDSDSFISLDTKSHILGSR